MDYLSKIYSKNKIQDFNNPLYYYVLAEFSKIDIIFAIPLYLSLVEKYFKPFIFQEGHNNFGISLLNIRHETVPVREHPMEKTSKYTLL